MDTSFTFPRQQVPAARPRPRKPVEPGSSARESNVLRASVLDAALELGLGTNPIVAGWMFDNALPEENEDEDPIASPGLTYTTSEESSNSALSPSSSAYSSGSSTKFAPYGAGSRSGNDKMFSKDSEPSITVVEPSPMNPNFEQAISGMGIPGGGITFPEMPPPPRPTTPNSGAKKLKKKKKDGYESEAGYMSEAGKKKDKEKSKKKAADPDSSAFFETEKEAKKRVKEEKKAQELERKRTKSLTSAAAKAAKKAEVKETGYDTDGGAIKQSKASKKSKFSSPPSAFPGDASLGYETDGYQSSTPKKSRTRFFKLSTKSSKADLRAGALPSVPPLPSTAPKLPAELIALPIAEKFATTFGALTLSEDADASTPAPPISASGSTSSSIVSPRTGTSVPQLKSSLTFPSVSTRDSQVSMASSSSNGSRSQQPHSPLSASMSHTHGTVESVGASIGSGSAHHGHGSGSYSTITSASHQQQGKMSVDTTASNSNGSATPPSNHTAKSGSIESGASSLRPPALSFPAIRAPSPSRRPPPVPPPATAPPVAPLKLLKSLRNKASLDNLHLPSLSRARSPSPMPATPVSPASPATPNTPYVVAPPVSSTASSPTLGVGFASPMQSMHLQPPSGTPGGSPISPVSPRSPARAFSGDNTPSPSPTVARQALSPPPRTLISLPNTAVQRPANLAINSNVSPIASSHSPSGLPGPSPNVLAYYDLPPPSPPPVGPLPSVPSQPSSSSTLPPPSPLSGSSPSNILPSPAALRQRVIDRTPRQLPPEFSAVFNGQTNIERGRQSPFPARPVVAGATVGAGVAGAPRANADPGAVGAAATGGVTPLRRYRDLYSPTSANTLMPPLAQHGLEVQVSGQGQGQATSAVKRARFRSKNSWIEDDYNRGATQEDDQLADEDEEPLYAVDDDDVDEEDRVDLANVLDRYNDRNTRQAEAFPPAQAEDRSLSIVMDDDNDHHDNGSGKDASSSQDGHATSEEAYVARPRPPRVREPSIDDDKSVYRDSEYQFDDGRTIGDRTSRWSGSIYSRASIMDEDSSGQTRDRLVRRVEAMLRENGNGGGAKGFVAPPVPRIPDAYMFPGAGANVGAGAASGSGTPGRSWNRF